MRLQKGTQFIYIYIYMMQSVKMRYLSLIIVYLSI